MHGVRGTGPSNRMAGPETPEPESEKMELRRGRIKIMISGKRPIKIDRGVVGSSGVFGSRGRLLGLAPPN